jgi:phosphohistidine phosphatase
MDLIVLRHGEAGKRMPSSGQDAERSLTVSGSEEVEQVAKCIKALKLEFNIIATSPLKRASETADIVAKIMKKADAVQLWDELKPESDSKSLYRRLAKLRADSTILIVGHEPYLGSMIGELIGGKAGVRISLKKAGMAKVEVTALHPLPSGELRWLLTPRLVKRVA